MKQLYIAGAWRDGAGVRQNINPSDIADVVGEYAQADAALVGEAIAAAAAAFPAWSRSGPQQRHDVLRRIADEIEARAAELGDLLAREEGKTLPEAKGEAMRASQIFRFFSGEALRPGGEAIPSVRPGIGVEITREGIGVVGIITPWNFPIAIPAWKIAPALCYGNAVVFKPADLVPGSAWALADIIARSGLPAGVFNLCMGRGAVVGEALLTDRRVAGVTFTGSQATGRRVAAACSARLARVQLEMGGKNPMVVLDDADLSVAVECAVQGAFFSTGQRCTASSRLIVTEGIHDRFIAAVAARMAGLVTGDARDPATHIGPVVDESQLAIDEGYIRRAKDEGGRLVCGGARVHSKNDGYYLAPALFSETTPAMTINREEVFGPVASVIRVRDYDEALAVANDTEFGLSSGICTTSLKYATHFRRNAEAGMVMVNLPTAGVDYHVPFGGRKGSSWGPREQGRYAAEFFTVVKTAYTLA